jgi:hypothetical protein
MTPTPHPTFDIQPAIDTMMRTVFEMVQSGLSDPDMVIPITVAILGVVFTSILTSLGIRSRRRR